VAKLTGNTAAMGISTNMTIGTYPTHAPDVWGAIPFPSITADYDRYVTADVTSPARNRAGCDDCGQPARLIRLADGPPPAAAPAPGLLRWPGASRSPGFPRW
jgi:hypothetical protein